jgi:hypothetical protein
VLAQVAEVRGIEKWIPQAIAAEPDSALPLLVSGARQVSWAWEARTSARAKNVAREQWQVFFERLAVAEEQLQEVAEREPGWLAPWYFLQGSGRGASLGRDVGQYRFEEAVRRCPGHLGSHVRHLQLLCKKWSGSHKEMHAFARQSMLNAPEGSPLGELVAHAHLERWLDLGGGEAGRNYLGRTTVRTELREAAARSILHPAYQRPRNWKAAYNSFAMVFSMGLDKKSAVPLFEPPRVR